MDIALLASSGWILDVVFFVLLAGGIAYGAFKGFIRQICKLAGTLFAIFFAVTFCVSMAGFLENVFGMTSAIANGIAGKLAAKEAYNIGLSADIAGAEVATALSEMGVGAFARLLIGLGYKNVALIPEGTTAAVLLGTTLAKWISIVISFVLLILIIKIGAVILGKLLSGLVDSVSPLRLINRLLGAIFGLFQAALMIFILLAICRWIPSDTLHNFISSGTVVGAIFNSDWFVNAASWAVSGEWFLNYNNG